MITRVLLPFVSVLAATASMAQAAPLPLADAELDRIVAADGSGNGNGNVGNNNGNNNQGNNNGNGNVGNGNGNGQNTDNNGNGSRARDPLNIDEILADILADIIAFDDGSLSKKARAEVRLRVYKARLVMLKAEGRDAKVRQLERKIERFVARHPGAEDGAERQRRNGITRRDLSFVFDAEEHTLDPRKGLQRIIDRGYKRFGRDGAAFGGFADRLRAVVLR